MVLTSYIELDLCDSGLLRVVEEPCGPGGEFSWGMTITAAGRAHLAWTATAKRPAQTQGEPE
jgi:hypothetical protein